MVARARAGPERVARRAAPRPRPLVTLLRRAAERSSISLRCGCEKGDRAGAVLATCALTTSAASCSTSTARSSTAPPTAAHGAARRASRCWSGSAPPGRPFVLFTNGSHVGAERFARGLRDDGLPVADDELLTPVESALHYLARRHPGALGAAVRHRGGRASTWPSRGHPRRRRRGRSAEVVFVAHADEIDARRARARRARGDGAARRC